MNKKVTRLYTGLSIEARLQARRARLIEAAILVYGQVGYHNASVKAVCTAAGLTERYFYQAFENSEALLAAAYTWIVRSLEVELAAAVKRVAGDRERALRTGLQTYFTALKANPAAARVFLVELSGVSGPMDDLVAELSREILQGLMADPKAAEIDRYLVDGLVGALIAIASGWVRSGYSRSAEDVTELCLPFFQAVMARR
jgi:AcrR family transcriptional regulator